MLAESGFEASLPEPPEGRSAFELDMRYLGQAYELTVGLRAPHSDALADAVAEFHRRHERTYGHSSPVDEVEIVTLRAHVSLPTPVPVWEVAGETPGEAPERRPVWTPDGAESYTVVAREAIAQRDLEGPLIVEQADSTIVVPRGWRIRQATAGTALLDRSAT
jgi:N-methylhydantoinase A